MFNSTNLTLSSDVDKDTYGKVTHSTHKSQEVSHFVADDHKVSKGVKIRNRYD